MVFIVSTSREKTSSCSAARSLAEGAGLHFVKHHELVMHKNSEQKNNRQRDADQPEKCTFSKAHF